LTIILKAIGRSRGWYYYRDYGLTYKSRAKRRPDAEDAIRRMLPDTSATYGYRRIHALLKEGGVRVTPKTVLRILRRNRWLSSIRSQKLIAGNLHTGTVMVKEPNKRWASDITGIRCWNGEKCRLAVIIDCADRMVIAWRFGRVMKTQDIIFLVDEALRIRGIDGKGLEFLSDNGPEYASIDLRAALVASGITVCRTPRRSPQSNGMAEAFFGSFKRDYVWQHELQTYEEVRRKIGGWIIDYNEKAPHSSLKMMSPAKFYRDWLKSR
jgi:putative transposase